MQSTIRKWIVVSLVVVVVILASVRCHDDAEEGTARNRRVRGRGRYVSALRRSRDRRRGGDAAVAQPEATLRQDLEGADRDPEAVTSESAPDVTAESMTSADAVSPSTTQGTITKEQWQKRMRAKYTRMFIIQSQILRGLGLRQQPNVTGRKVTKTDIGVINRYVQKLNETSRRYNTESMYAERLLVYNPSCETPPRTHKSWRDPESFRLYFPLEPPANNPTVQSRLMSAQLRLYKTGPAGRNSTKDDREDDDESAGAGGGSRRGDANKSKSLRRAKRILRKSKRQKFARSLKRGKKRRQSKNKRSRSNKGRGQMMDDEADDQLRVTVFWFRKPIKRDAKAKKQLAGSAMVSRSHVGWVEVNIKTPVKRWVKRPNKNFGIEIRVEDTDQRQLDPFTVFKGFDCGADNGEDNIYFNLASLNEVLLLNETLYSQNYNMTHPTLEIAHVDVPVTVTRPKRQTSETCVLKKEFFSMEELGLNDWIIAPGGIALGICEGHCLPSAPGAHYDTDRLVMNQNGQKGCCGPTELESFTFLQIMEDNRIAISSIPDFIVTKCGCRM